MSGRNVGLLVVRQVSSRRAAQNRLRAKIARDLGPQRCQWPEGCTRVADDWDEILTRGRGGSPTDLANALFLCRFHHDVKHAHPVASEAMGIMPSAFTNVERDASVNGMPERPILSFRINPDADQWITDTASAHVVSRTAVVRAMLSVATAHRMEVIRKIIAVKEQG